MGPVEGNKLRVLSYNIHQGLTLLKKKQTFAALKRAIEQLEVGLLLLQEVAGSSDRARHELPDGDEEMASQLEALADAAWPFHAYGRNSIFSGGFHGNAILSRYPIKNWKNVDITVRPMQPRGALHAEIELPGLAVPLAVFAVHLGLIESERKIQIRKLLQYQKIHAGSPSAVVMGGDFNDWRERASARFLRGADLKEVFLTRYGRHARTFPAAVPVLALDRIYYRKLMLKQVQRLKGAPWVRLSDHLPIVAEFSY